MSLFLAMLIIQCSLCQFEWSLCFYVRLLLHLLFPEKKLHYLCLCVQLQLNIQSAIFACAHSCSLSVRIVHGKLCGPSTHTNNQTLSHAHKLISVAGHTFIISVYCEAQTVCIPLLLLLLCYFFLFSFVLHSVYVLAKL